MNAHATPPYDVFNPPIPDWAKDQSVSIGNVMADFAGQSAEIRGRLRRASDAILIPACDGRRGGSRMFAGDFAVLKEFVKAIEDEFAFAGVLTRDEAKPDDVEKTYFGGDRLVLSGEPA